jgi:hypothetical protein
MPVFTLAPGSQPFALIAGAVAARIVAALNLQSALWVRTVANDDYEVTNVENVFAYLRVYGPSPVDAKTGEPFGDQGAGRQAKVVGRRMRVYIYSRSGQDVVGGDEIALTGTAGNQTQTIAAATWPGHFVFEEVVLNALISWVPTYTNPNTQVVSPLTLGPLHWLDSEDGPPVRKKENEEGLIRSHLDFQAVYISAITAGDPSQPTLPTPITIPQ